jgi:hypothetical protein
MKWYVLYWVPPQKRWVIDFNATEFDDLNVAYRRIANAFQSYYYVVVEDKNIQPPKPSGPYGLVGVFR